ncbi:hypothetical protein ABE41_007335 [Fictibacillus arsenicus]|uniref:AB hydrolase-1 domain-containing protein n=1 Tax=Fictibacillus arsenicus TaxID=255247 RepID=A0A1B1Z2X2_9BACL|nr:alpha/beta hydrolase [Fictibacillus arsenicus]ANX11817.1 hypothetical protein ABE41_007335 [Fictibacillus arsenicus]
MRYITYYKNKNVDWVVFLHGLGGNHNIFYKQIDIFKEHFNLLLVDFPGHGESKPVEDHENLLKVTSEKTIKILNDLHIKSAHFIGVSLGSIILQHLALKAPERIKSMVVGGGVAKWETYGYLLAKFANLKFIRGLLPYMTLYKIFTYLVLPKGNHKRSRDIFIRHAKKLGTKQQFIKWSNLAMDSNIIYKKLNQETNQINKIYISGSEDHMFIKGINAHVENEQNSVLHIIDHCGHVCNIEKAKEFNNISLDFILNQERKWIKKAVV